MNNLFKILLLILSVNFFIACGDDDDSVNPTPETLTYGYNISSSGSIGAFSAFASDITRMEDSLGIKSVTIDKPANKTLELAEDNKMITKLHSAATALRAKYNSDYLKKDTSFFGTFNKYYNLYRAVPDSIIAVDSMKISYPVFAGTRWEDESDSKNYIEFKDANTCTYSLLDKSGNATYKYTGLAVGIYDNTKAVFAIGLTSAIRSKCVYESKSYTFIKK